MLTSPPNYPSDLGALVILSDGTSCSLRPIRPDDAEGLVDFHQHLSLRSTYLRFFTVHPTLSAKEVERFTTVDYVDRLAFVVERNGQLIAVGRFDRIAGTSEAEVAFVVADDYQHHGLGSLLLDELVRAARDRGIDTFMAETLCENKPMLDVFHHSGFDMSSKVEYGTVWLRFGIAMTESYGVALAARDENRQIRRLPVAEQPRCATDADRRWPNGRDAHDGGTFHPEQQGRIFSVMDGVRDLHIEDGINFVAAPEADLEALTRVHTIKYLDELESFCMEGGGDIDPDTYARADSFTAARRAAGAGLEAIRTLELQGEGIAFVPVRPPGHHAEADRAMGFCLLNNVAVSAAALAAKGHRVLIVDWDIHHGNGTQSIFWDDPRVLYVSTHQWPLFPGTGSAKEVGGPNAVGLTVNIPLPRGATGDIVQRVFRAGRSAGDRSLRA